MGAAGTPKSRRGLVIHAGDDVAPISADNLDTALFLFQLLDNPKIANVIDTVNSRTVLILGRFTRHREGVLECLKAEVLRHNVVPLLFDFAGPAGRASLRDVRAPAEIRLGPAGRRIQGCAAAQRDLRVATPAPGFRRGDAPAWQSRLPSPETRLGPGALADDRARGLAWYLTLR